MVLVPEIRLEHLEYNVGAVTSIPTSVSIKSNKVKQQFENTDVVVLPPFKTRKDERWVKLLDLDHYTIQLGTLSFSVSVKRVSCLKILPVLSACTVHVPT
jgi:hypothetical protein